MRVLLRPVEDGDLDQLFAFERDPAAVEMAAFTRADPSDREAFDAHYRRVRANPENTLCAIQRDGVAGAALQAFLQVERTRPLFARVAEHNIASGKALTRAGFSEIDRETSYAPGVAREIVERIYRRER